MPDSTEPHEEEPKQPVESLKQKLQSSSFSHVAQRDIGGKDLLAGVGGVRGMIEAGIPPLAFLIGYLISQGDILISVLLPVVAGLIFLLVRVLQRSEVLPAISGVVGLMISAGLAYFTGDIMQHFLLGLLANVGLLFLFLGSIIIGRPLIGLISGMLLEKPDWRAVRVQKRMMTYATWSWVALFVLRLSIQIPLFLLDSAAELAVIRLLTGVPLLIIVLWLNWFFIRAAFFTDVSFTESQGEN